MASSAATASCQAANGSRWTITVSAGTALSPRKAGYRGKDGGIVDGSAGLQIFFGILAGTIPVVIATNSDPGKPISAIVQTALSVATSPRSRHAGDPPGQMKS